MLKIQKCFQIFLLTFSLQVLLDLIKMGLRRMHNLKLVDPPPQEGVDAALTELKLLKAVDEDTKGRFCITRHGQDLVRFPVDPPHAK